MLPITNYISVVFLFRKIEKTFKIKLKNELNYKKKLRQSELKHIFINFELCNRYKNIVALKARKRFSNFNSIKLDNLICKVIT